MPPTSPAHPVAPRVDPARPAISAAAAPTASAATPSEEAVGFQAARRYGPSVKQACWEGSEKTTQLVTVIATVDASGAVLSANASSTDPKLSACAAAQARAWTFPATIWTHTVRVPIRLNR
jgi:hypothetical protein